MAMQAEEAVPTINAQLVGNAFVEQYYNMLSKSPEIVHRFYQDSSEMSRPDSDGSMSSVSTMTVSSLVEQVCQGINELILSLDYKDCEVQILTADAQKSFGGGVIVLVTGFLTGKDEIRRKFTQLFFLAPQEGNGFFVLNDVLRYVEEEELTAVKVSHDLADSAPVATITPEPEPTPVSDNSVLEKETNIVAEDTIQPTNEASLPLENGNVTASEKDFVPNHVAETPQTVAPPVTVVATQEEDRQPSEAAVPVSQEDAPKKSYASIANALNFKNQPFQQKPKPVVRAPVAVAAAPPAEAPASAPAPRPARSNSIEKSNNYTVKGHSIFVANLPMDATPEQLIETFQKFGPIKPTGVQVRSYKQEKNCFGFVEFESAAAMENALQVEKIMIGNREAHIEKKKAGGEGGRFPPRRGGFRDDGFRGGRGGNYGGGRGGGYVKNEFENQQGGGGNYSGPARGGRNGGDGNQRVYQNGGGRGGGRQSRPAPPAAAAGAAVEGGKN
ncbi:Nuclear transport factor 2 [Linum perenne]